MKKKREDEELLEEEDEELLSDKEKFEKKAKDLKYYQNYAIIILLSIISLFFLPMLGSDGNLKFDIPNTFLGIMIWLISKFSVIILNILIFDQFVKQAKNNVRNHPLYLEAERLLALIGRQDETIYYHPTKYINDMRKEKKIKVLITSTISVFCLGNAFLRFSWPVFLSYAFTISTCIIFGWITMLDTEDIWTYTYIKYAKQEYNNYIKSQERIDNLEEKKEVVDA